MKYSRITLIIALAATLSGCAWLKRAPIQPSHKVKQTIQVANVSDLELEGSQNTTVLTDTVTPYITVYGYPKQINEIGIHHWFNKLIISYPKTQNTYPVKMIVHLEKLKHLSLNELPSNAHVKINTYMPIDVIADDIDRATISGNLNISHFNLSDDSHITIKGINSDTMIVKKSGDGIANLRGFIKNLFIENHDDGVLNLRWVKNGKIFLKANDQSQTILAGEANKLTTFLFDHAHLNARYLKTKMAEIQTHNQSKAIVNPIKHLIAKAMNNSEINYVHRPMSRSLNTAQEGVVLQLK